MRFWASVLAVLAVTCLMVDLHQAFGIDHAEAAAAVTNAKDALHMAFDATLEAEQVGANISDLVNRMNDAGAVLTRANSVLIAGNYSGAVFWAGMCKDLSDSIAADAVLLKVSAMGQISHSWTTVLLGVVGSAVFLIVLFAVWRRFRRFYRDKLLESKPEIVD